MIVPITVTNDKGKFVTDSEQKTSRSSMKAASKIAAPSLVIVSQPGTVTLRWT